MSNCDHNMAPAVGMLSVNLHGESLELTSVGEDKLVGRWSYGSYLANGVDRLLLLTATLGIRATFFVPGFEAVRSPSLIREIAAEGHEIAAHGWQHEKQSELGDAEGDVLRRGRDALGEVTGTAPVGWRSPDGTFGPRTLARLAELGYGYDSSFQDDDFPYLLDADGGTGMVELPQNNVLIDKPMFNIKMPDARVLKNWVEEFDGLNRIGAFSCLTVHPRQDYGVGRAPRMVMLERFLRHAMQSPLPVTFLTGAEVANMACGRASA
ncbi:polysaccharide deacetylase family protein [Hoeflea alexandrii]|uniref:polysaccharide deacetylase family protein n=1 Tax=Hoeflea alexandrii TaxID=288436 RepID=UPI0022AF0122|nr:polysaccharide deacetylase family protein [Hoeflea alexandrii]MCZ4291012.1 polysaccharide deacetylase family protein [Hoeflea alexandrii]